MRTRRSAPKPIIAPCSDPPEDLCGIINIAEGCNGGCSYCIVRKARGRLVSKSPEDIIDEARKLVKSGVAEIQLAGPGYCILRQ